MLIWHKEIFSISLQNQAGERIGLPCVTDNEKTRKMDCVFIGVTGISSVTTANIGINKAEVWKECNLPCFQAQVSQSGKKKEGGIRIAFKDKLTACLRVFSFGAASMGYNTETG